MKGIIIAAGPSTRLRPLTEKVPKCMLTVKGKPLIQNVLELFKGAEITDVSIIRGYRSEKIDFTGITYFQNDQFWNNNILHSLLYARPKLEEAMNSGEGVIITYSDIWYDPAVLESLLQSGDDIDLVVDVEWMDAYRGRTDHPIDEAENVIISKDGRITKIGKHIFTHNTPREQQGEFIGLCKLTPEGIKILLKHVDRLNRILASTDSFQNAREWQKSYLTDIFQELIDCGEMVHAVKIRGNWREFDTVQDFENQ